MAWLARGCYGTRLYGMGLERWTLPRREDDMMYWDYN